MAIKIFLSLLMICSIAAAETTTYLIYRQKCYPNDKYVTEASPQEERLFINSGKKNITLAGGQPFRVTNYEINFDGKYAIFNVDDELDPDKGYFRSMQEKGCAKLLWNMEVVSAYDARTGGQKTEIINNTLSELPTDYYWVESSSGT